MSVTHSEQTHSTGDIIASGCGCCHGTDANGGTAIRGTRGPGESHESCGAKDGEGKEGGRLPDNVEINPLFARPKEARSFPKFIMPREGSLPETAYQLVHD